MPQRSFFAESMSVAEPARDFLRRRLCAAYEDEFFLYEKMGRRAIDTAGSISEAGGGRKRPSPPPPPKRWESKGSQLPLAEREAEPRGLARLLGKFSLSIKNAHSLHIIPWYTGHI